MKARLTELTSLGLTHSLKKAAGEKKRKKDKESSDSKKAPSGHKNGSKDTTLRTSPDPHSDVKTKPASNGKSLSGSIKNATTASLTNKVLTHEREMAKRRKLEMSDNVKSLFKSKDDKTDAGKGKGGGDFMTRGYSLG